MTPTKIKPKVIYGDHLPITAYQKKTILHNCNFNMDIKDEWVQWATNDDNRTSLRSITQAQAIKILNQQTGAKTQQPTANNTEDNWGFFDKKNKQHLTLLSQLRTLQWVVQSDKYGELPDIARLSAFLKSEKSPVKKPLKKMNPSEVSTIIECFKSMIKKNYK